MRHENEMIDHGREAGFGKVVWKDFGEIPVDLAWMESVMCGRCLKRD